ncbi:metal ABC transporter substrate-binding protein [uncultured Desulfobulbus sp.]|uniref:metal ABC transporter substrate-binding protein n=1 Tax=uncultured Desulfobulbus sp. TaxID=239745 RepID=UPI0029C7DBF4|nr:metal ABC transporter substrate-binding protein [uncultured Desulfobulbus sp.]
MKPNVLRLCLVFLGCCSVVLLRQTEASAEKTLTVLASTFPLYQITRNITAGASGIEVDLMIPAQMGCPHDYALTPQDMRKLAKADILVINGQGMEEFLGAPLQKANPALKIIDSSQGIGQILQYSDMEQDEHKGHDGENKHLHDKDLHEGEHEQHHGGSNPHLFASPRMAALLAGNIVKALGEFHPPGATVYTTNGQGYSQRLNLLADDLAALGKRLANNRIVTQHGVFDYLARDMGLEVVAVVQAHAGQEPSAAEILAIVKTIRAKKAGAIFTEPQYPESVGKTIAKEASIAAARLDPAANGPERASLDYYEQVMRTNLNTLEKTLGSN